MLISRGKDYKGEDIFGEFALQMTRLGWSVFPQTRDGEKRRPAMINGEGLKWGKYVDVRPTEKEIIDWSIQCPGYNLAAIFGPASGHTFAIDIDVNEETFSLQVQDIAEEILGLTPFRRVGRYPRMILIYRHAPDDPVRNASPRFVTTDEKGNVVASDEQIEVLAARKPATFYGLHHKTGQYFHWMQLHPFAYGPEHAPLVTSAKLQEFYDAVGKIRPFYINPSSFTETMGSWDFTDTEGVVMPRLIPGTTPWSEDENGLIFDGREQFLYYLTRKIVSANPAKATDQSKKEHDKLKKLIFDQFREKTTRSGRWNDNFLKTEINEKFNRSVGDILSGRLKGFTPRKDKAGNLIAQKALENIPQRPESEFDTLSFLPKSAAGVIKVNPGSFRKAMAVQVVDSPSVEAARKERALIEDRSLIEREVQDKITSSLDDFFNEVYNKDRHGLPNIHVLKAPTGAGKTTRTIRYVAEDPRTKDFFFKDQQANIDEEISENDINRKSPGPIVFSLPTYNNIDELRLRADVLNLDGALNDEELSSQALERGLIPEDELEARLEDLRRDAMNAGLKTMVYRGKLAAGCQMGEKIKLLMGAGIGSAGLCKASVKTKDGEKEDKFCQFYATCPAIQQRKDIAESHVVFLPHAFLTLAIPEELKQVRAVIADERIFHLFLHTTTMHLSTLRRPRKRPKLTKKEKEQGLDPDELLALRDMAADIAVNALMRGSCPAQTLFDHTIKLPNQSTLSGQQMVKIAARVCGNAITASTDIVPDISFQDLFNLCSTPTGTEVREEFRFWKIIDERIEALTFDKVHQDLALASGEPLPKKAKGRKDMRIQMIFDETATGIRTELIRLSWRTKPNWLEVPLMLLDASASAEITGKLFDDRNVIVHDIDAPLNVKTVAIADRTYSNVSLVAGRHKNVSEKVGAADLKDKIRKSLCAISCYFGWSRVVVGASVIIRRAVNTAWAAPPNLDWCHFGAMRGLDFAKYHAAAVSIGRMEVPVRSIDGLVAALTFDDDMPEEPFDANGNGKSSDNQDLKLPLENQIVKLRSGHDAAIAIPNYPGKWARIVQKQYREEELRQFLGRLRPVYRKGEPPVWFAISKIIPEGVIVDDIISLDDLITSSRRNVKIFDTVRLCSGILEPELGFLANITNYTDLQSVKMEMKRLNLDTKVSKDNRITWGFTPYTLQGPDQSVKKGFIQTCIKDQVDTIRNMYRQYFGWYADEMQIEVGHPSINVIHTMQREMDWVEKELGTKEERQRDEFNSRRRVAESALMSFSSKTITMKQNVNGDKFAVPVHVPMGTPESMAISTIDHAISMDSTDVMWIKTLAGHTESVSSPVLPVHADYDHFGDGAFDGMAS